MSFKEKWVKFQELNAGKNIILRKGNPKKDVDAFFEILSDTENFTYYESYNNPPKDKNMVMRIVENMVRDFEKHYTYIWVITQKKDDKPIGRIHLFNFSNENKCAEIGYFLDKKYWNKGIMTSCVNSITKFAFEHLEIERIIARMAVDNIGSWKAVEKNKYTREGKLKHSFFAKDKVYDSYLYAKIFTDKKKRMV